MKKFSLVIVTIVLLTTCLMNCGPDKSKLCFSGRIVDEKGNPVSGAVISLGGKETSESKTSEKGNFTLCVNRNESYVLNVTKLGFGFASKVYADTTSSIVITLTPATVVEELNPAEEITITDTTPATSVPPTPDVAHLASPLDTLAFVYDAAGNLIAFGAPPEIADTYEAVADFAPQQTGATITVEPDALEEANEEPTRNGGGAAALFQGTKEKGNVTGSISTIDIYSPDGMPGDYTTQMQGGRGFMVTYGAADVNFYRDGKPLQLKKGKFATLTIPVDTLTIIYGQKLPETMPLLVYDKNSGLWEKDGDNVGVLNKERTAYVAKISHFSVFNMDEEFGATTAACIKLCSDAPPMGAKIEITGDNPGHVKYLTFGASLCAGTGGCAVGQTAYAINNLKPTTAIGVRLFDAADVIRSSYVFISGTAGNTNTCGTNYSECVAVERISWTTPCYQNADAVGSIDGPIVAIQPAGGTNFKVSWIYIDPGASGSPLTNTNPVNYKVEYITVTNQDLALVQTDAAWTDAATLSNTNIKNTSTISIPTSGGTDPVLVRVIAQPFGAASFISGSIRILNLATITPLTQFESDWTAITVTCENNLGQTIL